MSFKYCTASVCLIRLMQDQNLFANSEFVVIFRAEKKKELLGHFISRSLFLQHDNQREQHTTLAVAERTDSLTGCTNIEKQVGEIVCSLAPIISVSSEYKCLHTHKDRFYDQV